MLAISSKTIWALMSSVIVLVLPLVCDAKPERLSKSHPLADPLTVDRFLKERIVVDGGMVANGLLMQFIADILDQQVDRPVIAETTALGAAILAMLGRGEISDLDSTSALWKLDTSFNPAMSQANRDNLLSGWRLAVKRTLLGT